MRMNHRVQRGFILGLFVAAVLFIAYPLVAQKDKVLATPTKEMHIKIKGTDKKEGAQDSQENQAVHPILNK